MAVVDVVVPTYNNLPGLRACLGSLATQVGADFRVVVCVDGSSDGTLEFLRGTPFSFPVLIAEHPGGEHRGRAATRNLALSAIDGEFVLLLDSDMRLRPDGVAAHVRLLRDRPCVSVGAIVYENARQDLWARYLMTRGRNRFAAGAALPFNQFVTANSALTTTEFVASGGFDERITGYGGEDTEFAYRLSRAAGTPFAYNAHAIADTTESKALKTALGQLREYGATNLAFIHHLHPDMPHVFLTDRRGSRRLKDRFLMAVMNPATDLVVDQAMRFSPFAVQRHLINYQVVRAVNRGYADALRREDQAGLRNESSGS